jgi:hypothetical protein
LCRRQWRSGKRNSSGSDFRQIIGKILAPLGWALPHHPETDPTDNPLSKRTIAARIRWP